MTLPFRHAFRLVTTAALFLPWCPWAGASDRASTLIAEENRKPGASDWQLTRVRPDNDGFRSPWIEGYCSKQSVQAGESIDIMVSTNPPRKFQIEIFRMGYYGGSGAQACSGRWSARRQGSAGPGARAARTCTSADGSPRST